MCYKWVRKYIFTVRINFYVFACSHTFESIYTNALAILCCNVEQRFETKSATIAQG